MANILVRGGEEPVLLSARAARRLLDRGDGDAALLYLAILRHQGNLPPRSLAGELRWDRPRIEAAEMVLRELELVTSPAAEAAGPERPQAKPEYQRMDVVARLESSGEFRELSDAVEERLGRKLTTPDLAILLGLYDHLGLPSDVIYLLVCHCAEKVARRNGGGRRPTLRQIEKEGYAWARLGVDNQPAAAEYLRRYAARRSEIAGYMRALGLEDRLPVPSEEKYLTAWQEMGFPAETVALAYDRTVLNCQTFKWSYCNGILRRWHTAGWHTPAEVEAGDRPAGQPRAASGTASGAADAEMLRYIQELRGDRG